MSRRILALGTLPVLFVLLTAGCSDGLGPNAGQISARRGADDLPGDNRGVDLPGDNKGVDLTPHFRRGEAEPNDNRGVDAPKAGGADDPATHT
jgi:hypothetical protein